MAPCCCKHRVVRCRRTLQNRAPATQWATKGSSARFGTAVAEAVSEEARAVNALQRGLAEHLSDFPFPCHPRSDAEQLQKLLFGFQGQ